MSLKVVQWKKRLWFHWAWR